MKARITIEHVMVEKCPPPWLGIKPWLYPCIPCTDLFIERKSRHLKTVWATQPNVTGHCQNHNSQHVRIQRGAGGPDPPWKITKIKGFLAILVRIPWKIIKLPSQRSMLGHHRHASETPLNDVLLAGRWWPAYSGILSSTKKNVIKVGPPLT